MQGCVILCGTVVFFQKSRNLSRSLLTNNNFYCAQGMIYKRSQKQGRDFDTKLGAAIIIIRGGEQKRNAVHSFKNSGKIVIEKRG